MPQYAHCLFGLWPPEIWLKILKDYHLHQLHHQHDARMETQIGRGSRHGGGGTGGAGSVCEHSDSIYVNTSHLTSIVCIRWL